MGWNYVSRIRQNENQSKNGKGVKEFGESGR